jgi:hypothetical protein
MSETSGFTVLFDILSRLKEAKIYHSVGIYRYDMVTINAAVPGQRWEIDIAEDGSVDFEIFRSDGKIEDATSLDELIKIFSD